ncbi:MAG: GNAT family N-acetyltransferase [Chloroflexi bacterium]|nr:GNAT family N-acetyltransferase [Chloroflexota bacterium]
MHQSIVSDPHVYLLLLGVEPGSQARGNGSRLVDAVLHRADEGGYPVNLETLNLESIRFYEKRGFQVSAETPLPGGAISVWYLVRKPVR